MLERNYLVLDNRAVKHRPVRICDGILKKYALNFCYLPNSYNYSFPYLSEIQKNTFLADKLNQYLQQFLEDPNSMIPLKHNIVCQDILNPHIIPHIELEYNAEFNRWHVPEKIPFALYTPNNMNDSSDEILNPGRYTLIEDDNYLLVIRNNYNEFELYIYKK